MAFGKYDVVHAVEEAAHLAAPVARLLRLPLVMDVDSSIPDQLRYTGFATRGPLLWAAERLERSALASARTVVTVCTSLTDGVRRARARGRGLPDRGPAARRRGRAAVRGGGDDPAHGARASDAVRSCSTPATSSRTRACALLVDAAALLPELWFVFMGGDADAVAAVRARLAAAGAGARCVFTGTRPPSELPAFLALADVLVSPRVRGENTPFKVYSYMASGKPLVATRIADAHAAARRHARDPGRAGRGSDRGRHPAGAHRPVRAQARDRRRASCSSASTARGGSARRSRLPTPGSSPRRSELPDAPLG